jgi:ABC-type microcin C transport system permease subunit YejB
MADSVEFIDCPSLSISYDTMGIATVNFTVVRNEPGWPSSDIMNKIEAGGRVFEGYVSSASLSQIPNTGSWFETRVTLISLAK